MVQKICEQILKSLLVLVVQLSVTFAACRFLKSQPSSSREGPLLKRSSRVGSYSEALRYPAQWVSWAAGIAGAGPFRSINEWMRKSEETMQNLEPEKVKMHRCRLWHGNAEVIGASLLTHNPARPAGTGRGKSRLPKLQSSRTDLRSAPVLLLLLQVQPSRTRLLKSSSALSCRFSVLTFLGDTRLKSSPRQTHLWRAAIIRLLNPLLESTLSLRCGRSVCWMPPEVWTGPAPCTVVITGIWSRLCWLHRRSGAMTGPPLVPQPACWRYRAGWEQVCRFQDFESADFSMEEESDTRKINNSFLRDHNYATEGILMLKRNTV